MRSLEDGAAPARLDGAVDRLDEKAWEAALAPDGTRTVAGALRAELPDRLAAALCAAAGVDPARPLAQLRREERLRLVETLVRGELPWTGHEGYAKAEVTGGGVSLDGGGPARRWRAAGTRASFSAARSSTRSARSAATTSSGRGRRAARRESARRQEVAVPVS